MIFSIDSRKDVFLEKAYMEALKDLNEFFGINWTNGTPIIITVKDRKTIDILKGKKTERWVVGWADDYRIVYILDRKNYEKECAHKYSDEAYIALLKHEMVHLFINAFCSSSELAPIWLLEGIAIYLSGQNSLIRKPDSFSKFLSFYNCGGEAIYSESGFAVEYLIKSFGKDKLLELLKSLRHIKSEKEFMNYFEGIYGFMLKYKNFKIN